MLPGPFHPCREGILLEMPSWGGGPTLSPEEEVGSRQLTAAEGRASQQGKARKGPGSIGCLSWARERWKCKERWGWQSAGYCARSEGRRASQSVNFIQRALKARFKQLCCVVRHNSM